VAGDRGGDLAGVQRTQRSAAQRTERRSVRQAGVVHAQREGNNARGPRARERAAVVIHAGAAGSTWLFGIAMKAQP